MGLKVYYSHANERYLSTPERKAKIEKLRPRARAAEQEISSCKRKRAKKKKLYLKPNRSANASQTLGRQNRNRKISQRHSA